MFKKIWKWLKIVLGGIVMVVTDTIPGLSGSVFLAAGGLLHPVWTKWEDILKPKKKGDRLLAILFYIAFGIGTTVGMFGFAQIIEISLREIPSITFWFFFVASIWGVLIYFKKNKGEMLNSGRSKIKLGIFMITGFTIVFLFILITFFLRGRVNIIDLKNSTGVVSITDSTKMTLICLAGFFSAYAMFTPGMSGGLIILMFGVFGEIFGGILANPFGNFWVLVIYGICVFAGILTALFTLDKIYKKFTVALNWILFSFVSGSLLAIPLIFDVFIPAEQIRWIYITIAIGLASSLGFITFKLIK